MCGLEYSSGERLRISSPSAVIGQLMVMLTLMGHFLWKGAVVVGNLDLAIMGF